MTSDSDALRAESNAFGRYLVGGDPGTYACESYAALHGGGSEALNRPVAGVDRALLWIGRRSSLGAGLADAYAGLFASTGVFRCKMVAMYGVLESTPDHHLTLDRVPRGGWLALFGLGVKAAAAGCIAVLLFAPLHLILGAPTEPSAKPGAGNG